MALSKISEDIRRYNARIRTQLITVVGTSDPNALHSNIASEIMAITEKVAPVGTDVILIEDSTALNVKKKVLLNNLIDGGTF